MPKKLPELPSIVWVLLFVGGLILFIGAIITFFVLISTVPGFASAIFIIIGLVYVFVPSTGDDFKDVSGKSIAQAIGVGFFALMGMAIDQPGNFIYNYPLRYFCPAETQLNRSVDVSHPLPGRTDMVQDFRCENSTGKLVKRLGDGPIIATRFVEYLILAYLFIAIRTMKNKVTKISHAKIEPTTN